MDVLSGECVLLKTVEVGEEVERVWCPKEGRHVAAVVRCAAERQVRLYEWGSLKEVWRRRVPPEAEVRCSASQVAVCCRGRLDLISTEDWTELTLSLPECKAVCRLHLLSSAPLLRLEPLDNNYESVYSLHTNDWTVVHKSPKTPVGARQFFEYCHGDYFLLVNCLLVEDSYLYSNVHLYRGRDLLSRAIVSNCRSQYFEATFTDKTLLFSVADYRLTLVDLITLRLKEVYVRPGFDGLFSVLERYFVLTYRDKLEVWDYSSMKRLYSVPLIENDRVQVKDDFVAISSWPCSSLPPSLRILSYKEPALAS